MKKRSVLLAGLLVSGTLWAADGEKLFKMYCWGCHHQTAEAFGPSFRSIASKRTKEEIIAQIVDPKETSKLFGYRRSSMPSFSDLDPDELDALADYIMKFKDAK